MLHCSQAALLVHYAGATNVETPDMSVDACYPLEWLIVHTKKGYATRLGKIGTPTNRHTYLNKIVFVILVRQRIRHTHTHTHTQLIARATFAATVCAAMIFKKKLSAPERKKKNRGGSKQHKRWSYGNISNPSTRSTTQ